MPMPISRVSVEYSSRFAIFSSRARRAGMKRTGQSLRIVAGLALLAILILIATYEYQTLKMEELPFETIEQAKTADVTKQWKGTEPRLLIVAHPEDISEDRKSTRLNSSHSQISYAVFCWKKKEIPDLTAVRRAARGSGPRPAAPAATG